MYQDLFISEYKYWFSPPPVKNQSKQQKKKSCPLCFAFFFNFKYSEGIQKAKRALLNGPELSDQH